MADHASSFALPDFRAINSPGRTTGDAVSWSMASRAARHKGASATLQPDGPSLLENTVCSESRTPARSRYRYVFMARITRDEQLTWGRVDSSKSSINARDLWMDNHLPGGCKASAKQRSFALGLLFSCPSGITSQCSTKPVDLRTLSDAEVSMNPHPFEAACDLDTITSSIVSRQNQAISQQVDASPLLPPNEIGEEGNLRKMEHR